MILYSLFLFDITFVFTFHLNVSFPTFCLEAKGGAKNSRLPNRSSWAAGPPHNSYPALVRQCQKPVELSIKLFTSLF
jgi:hypothetical protein